MKIHVRSEEHTFTLLLPTRMVFSKSILKFGMRIGRKYSDQVPDISLGFDFGDLFWGADAVVNTWNDCIGLSDKVPAIIFTDRTKEDVWLPAGTEKCCNVIFFDEYDCDYPLYDFTQLIKRPDQE